MRLSRIWRIVQIKEGVIQQGWRPKWITSSEICRILHILWKPNSIIAFSNIFKLERKMSSLFFLLTKNNTTSSPGFLVNSSIICSRLHFWYHGFNITKFFLNLVNSNWLWWIMHVVLTNGNREMFWLNNNDNSYVCISFCQCWLHLLGKIWSRPEDCSYDSC